MALPDFETIMQPLLEYVKDGEEHSMIEIEKHLARHFNLSEEERMQLKPSGGETIFYNRIRWARLYLKKAGLLDDPRTGYTRITAKGLNLLKQKVQKIDREFLMQFPEFVNFHSTKRDTKTYQVASSATVSKTPEDMIIEGYEAIRNNLEKEIINRIINKPPEFFERLVLELVRKMGYGIDHEVLGRTGDGGIDGVIKEDKLGLDEIYFQAKRWKENVSVHQVRDFAGALLAKKSKKGIFITTSDFSGEAYNYVKSTDFKIILINGELLAHLMFDYDVGVTVDDVYQLKRIDEDYFAE